MADPWFQALPSKEQKKADAVAVMRDFITSAREMFAERNPTYAADRIAMKSLQDYMAEGLSRREATDLAREDVLLSGWPEPTRL